MDTLIYTVCIPLERGPHVIYAQATDSAGTVTTSPITYVVAYELAEHGIDVYSGDAKLDVIEPVLHDALLPDLPTLNFSCATLLTGNIGAVIRERGLRQYQFTIIDIKSANGLYQYICDALETYALTTAIMTLQTAYGATSDAIKLLAPSLNIVDSNRLLTIQQTYPQLLTNITPVDIIDQLMVQALAQGSVRNGNLYVFPLDVSAQVPDYHMQASDKLTTWEQDSRIYGSVVAHYVVKQYPTPSTTLTLNDAANWKDADGVNVLVSDVTQVTDTLLPVPSGALGMLKSIGNCSRASLSAAFKDFDRIRFNWLPVTATTVLVSLQQDAGNKLELTHTFAGQTGAGFLLAGSPGVSTDTLMQDISCDDTGSGGTATKFVTTVTGTTTARCSYRVILLDADDAPIWTDAWSSTFGNTFTANVPNDGPASVAQTYQATTVRIEFKDTYLIAGNYGVQCITCTITAQTWSAVGSHSHVVSSTTYPVVMHWYDDPVFRYDGVHDLSGATGGQWYVVSNVDPPLTLTQYGNYFTLKDDIIPLWQTAGPDRQATAVVTIFETAQDYAWVSSTFVWSPAFNLFESLDLSLADFTRTGNPMNFTTIALTFTGDNYVDTLALVADNPLPIVVHAGTGSRAYTVTDDFGSEAGAQAYADGLLPIVSVPREQYTRDVPLSTDLSVGDSVYGDDNIFTINAIDYRQDGKTVSAGRFMDTLMTRLAEQARRLGTLERKG